MQFILKVVLNFADVILSSAILTSCNTIKRHAH